MSRPRSQWMGWTFAGPAAALFALFFAYPLANCLFPGLGLGATVILDPTWSTPERVAELVRRHRPTILFSVPTLYHQMLQAGVAAPLREEGIRRFISAGEALPAHVSEGWLQATGHYPTSGYGTSETLALMLYSTEPSQMLRPTPGTQMRPAASESPEAPSRIWVHAPAVALGYWRGHLQQEPDFQDGWFSPGDVFLQHGDGLEFAGRIDDLVKISGRWVSTQWVEQALAAACPGTVHQVAAVGAPTPEGLTGLAVLAVAAPGQHAEARAQLTAEIADQPRYRRPRWVHWVDELPLTVSGKLMRGALRSLHDHHLSATATSDRTNQQDDRRDDLLSGHGEDQRHTDPDRQQQDSPKARITMRVNGEDDEILFAPYKTLLEVLREDLYLTGTKHGCELGECGACAVLLDGIPVLSCLVLALECDGREVDTVEGLATGTELHPLQAAFADLGGSQCGYCTPGMLMTATALLNDEPHPTREQIRSALAGNLCRCTGYLQIFQAVERAAAQLRERTNTAAGAQAGSSPAEAAGGAA